MNNYIFRLVYQNQTIIVEAPDIWEAMKRLDKDWYPGALEKGFEVSIADGLSYEGKEEK